MAPPFPQNGLLDALREAFTQRQEPAREDELEISATETVATTVDVDDNKGGAEMEGGADVVAKEVDESQLDGSKGMLILHLIRHGTVNKHGRDPLLTADGKDECRSFGSFFPWERITHIMCSPLSRAVETACIVFKPFLERQKIIAVPDLQSAGDEVWNIGLHPRTLEGYRFIDENIDWSLVHIGWNQKKTGRYERTLDALYTRVDEFRRTLLALKPLPDEKTVEVVIIGHQSIFGLLCKDNTLWHPLRWKQYKFNDENILVDRFLENIHPS